MPGIQFCSNCGSPVEPHDAFCSTCGRRIEITSQAQAQAAPAPRWPPPPVDPPIVPAPPRADPPRPYSNGRRLTYGLLWAGWTLLLAIAAIAILAHGPVLVGLLCLVLVALAGHYDYRIWTYRAKRLLFLIII